MNADGSAGGRGTPHPVPGDSGWPPGDGAAHFGRSGLLQDRLYDAVRIVRIIIGHNINRLQGCGRGDATTVPVR
jgi:hypothetical protein